MTTTQFIVNIMVLSFILVAVLGMIGAGVYGFIKSTKKLSKKYY